MVFYIISTLIFGKRGGRGGARRLVDGSMRRRQRAPPTCQRRTGTSAAASLLRIHRRCWMRAVSGRSLTMNAAFGSAFAFPPKSCLILFGCLWGELGPLPRSRATGEKRGLSLSSLFCLFFYFSYLELVVGPAMLIGAWGAIRHAYTCMFLTGI